MSDAQDQNQLWGQLMKEAQDGNQNSYRTLLKEVSPVLKGFFANRLSDSASAEDAAQDTLMALHKARATYDPSRPFKSWLFAIAKYKMIDSIRKTSRTRKYETSAIEDLDLGAEFIYESENDSIEIFNTAIQELPEKQREAITLLKVQGLSIKEAAKVALVSESALKVRAHRGYQLLKEKIGKAYNG